MRTNRSRQPVCQSLHWRFLHLVINWFLSGLECSAFNLWTTTINMPGICTGLLVGCNLSPNNHGPTWTACNSLTLSDRPVRICKSYNLSKQTESQHGAISWVLSALCFCAIWDLTQLVANWLYFGCICIYMRGYIYAIIWVSVATLTPNKWKIHDWMLGEDTNKICLNLIGQ